MVVLLAHAVTASSVAHATTRQWVSMDDLGVGILENNVRRFTEWEAPKNGRYRRALTDWSSFRDNPAPKPVTIVTYPITVTVVFH